MNRLRTMYAQVKIVHLKRRGTVRTKEDPNQSIHHRVQNWTCVRQLPGRLKKFDLKAYKIQLIQEINPHDHHARRTFDELAEDKISIDAFFSQNFVQRLSSFLV